MNGIEWLLVWNGQPVFLVFNQTAAMKIESERICDKVWTLSICAEKDHHFWWLKDFELMKAAGLNALRLGAVLPSFIKCPTWNLQIYTGSIMEHILKLWRCHVAWCGTTTRSLQWKLSSYRAGHCGGGIHLWDLHFGRYAPGPNWQMLQNSVPSDDRSLWNPIWNPIWNPTSTVNTCQLMWCDVMSWIMMLDYDVG